MFQSYHELTINILWSFLEYLNADHESDDDDAETLRNTLTLTLCEEDRTSLMWQTQLWWA